MTTTLPAAPRPGLAVVELTSDRAPLLQRFFDANPAYFLATSGEPAGPAEAVDTIASRPPPGWRYRDRRVVGWVDARGALAAMADVVFDLLAPGVFHVGLFIVATERHGTGDARAFYDAIERWARDDGARWMRLGVVRGHARAERFWATCGFVPVRARDGMRMGSRVVTVRNLVKPLADEPLDRYFAAVPRDRPDEGPAG